MLHKYCTVLRSYQGATLLLCCRKTILHIQCAKGLICRECFSSVVLLLFIFNVFFFPFFLPHEHHGEKCVRERNKKAYRRERKIIVSTAIHIERKSQRNRHCKRGFRKDELKDITIHIYIYILILVKNNNRKWNSTCRGKKIK